MRETLEFFKMLTFYRILKMLHVLTNLLKFSTQNLSILVNIFKNLTKSSKSWEIQHFPKFPEISNIFPKSWGKTKKYKNYKPRNSPIFTLSIYGFECKNNAISCASNGLLSAPIDCKNGRDFPNFSLNVRAATLSDRFRFCSLWMCSYSAVRCCGSRAFLDFRPRSESINLRAIQSMIASTPSAAIKWRLLILEPDWNKVVAVGGGGVGDADRVVVDALCDVDCNEGDRPTVALWRRKWHKSSKRWVDPTWCHCIERDAMITSKMMPWCSK